MAAMGLRVQHVYQLKVTISAQVSDLKQVRVIEFCSKILILGEAPQAPISD